MFGLAQGYDFSTTTEAVAYVVVCIEKYLLSNPSRTLYSDPFLNMKLNWDFSNSDLFQWLSGTKMSGIGYI